MSHVGENGHGDATEDDERLLRAALELAEIGMRVFPVHTVLHGRCSCGSASCEDQGKHPRVDGWQLVASTDRAVITKWWSAWPDANIGLTTGAGSGVVVLDVDGAEGMASLDALEAKHGPIGATPRSHTPRPGQHILFAHPGYRVKNSTGKRAGIAPGLDVRGDGGYIIAPPSRHLNGGRYAWAAGMKLGTVDFAPMPAWVAPPPEPERVRPKPTVLVHDARRSKYGQSALERECELVRTAAEGSRNDQLNASAFALGQLVGGGVLDKAQVECDLLEAALHTGLSRREIDKTIDSGVTDGMEEPRGVPESSWTQSPAVNDQSSPPDLEVEPSTTSASSARAPSGIIEWIDAPAIAAPLPPTRWAVPGLHIGPGRATLIAGYGASAKTLSAQAMALAKAAGRPIWNHYDCEPGVVLHIDYEQGRHASIKRYQRLAYGHDIDLASLGNRLRLAVLPRVFLDQRGALDAYLRVCEGVELVIIDALRGAAPSSDENDSKFRSWIDLINLVSDRTGTAFILLHHAGKPKEGHGADARTLARGSSAIFDACGCVLNLVAKTGEAVKYVSQVKMPAEAEGSSLDDFRLAIEDVARDGNPTGAVRVVWARAAATDPTAKARVAYDRDAERLIAVVRAESGIAANALIERSGMGRTRAFKMLSALVEEGRLVAFDGAHQTKRYRATDVR